MNDKEKRVKNERTIEAMEKDLMGAGGKFGCIVRNLGQTIESNSSLYEWTAVPDWDGLPGSSATEEEGIRDWDESESRVIGFIFDGLSRGMHLEIKYLDDDSTLSVYYKGILVFREVAGDLQCYAPRSEWENLIDQLYEKAKKIEISRKKVIEIEDREKARSLSDRFLRYLEQHWGL